MAALTAARDTQMRNAELFEFPVAADTVLYAGGMGAMYLDGHISPADGGAPEARVIGRVEETADNRGGLAGAIRVKLRRGCFLYGNSAGAAEITLADVGNACYAADDQTVSKTGAGTMPIAGVVRDVEPGGVWVDFVTHVVPS